MTMIMLFFVIGESYYGANCPASSSSFTFFLFFCSLLFLRSVFSVVVFRLPSSVFGLRYPRRPSPWLKRQATSKGLSPQTNDITLVSKQRNTSITPPNQSRTEGVIISFHNYDDDDDDGGDDESKYKPQHPSQHTA